MWNVCIAWTNDPDIEGHVPIATLYAVIIFESHISSYSEWTSECIISKSMLSEWSEDQFHV